MGGLPLEPNLQVDQPHELLPTIENLVLEGGGLKGLAHIGGLEKLDEAGMYTGIKRITGSSASGIIAMLAGLGYSIDDLKEIMTSLNFLDLIDTHNSFWLPDKFKEVEELITFLKNTNKRGISRGDVFYELAKSWVAKALPEFGPHATFADLKKAIDFDLETKGYSRLKNILFTATNLSNGLTEYLSFDNPSCLDMPLALAGRIIMAFPGAFEGINWKGNFYVAGNVENKSLINIYDSKKFMPQNIKKTALKNNPYTLGLKIDTTDEVYGYDSKKLSDFIDYFSKLIGVHKKELPEQVERKTNLVRIIDEDVSTLDFTMNDEKKQKLLNSGKKAIEDWLSYRHQNAVKKNQTPIQNELKIPLSQRFDLSQEKMLSIIDLQDKLNETINIELKCLELHNLICKNILNLLEIKPIEDIVFNFYTEYQDILVKIDELENKFRIAKGRQDNLEPEYLEKITALHDQKNGLHNSFNLSLENIEGLEPPTKTLIRDFVSEVIRAKEASTALDPSTSPLPFNLQETKTYLEKSKSAIHEELEAQQTNALKLKNQHNDLQKRLAQESTYERLLALEKDMQKSIREQSNLYCQMGSWVKKHRKVTYGVFNWLMRVTPAKCDQKQLQEKFQQADLKYIHDIRAILPKIQENIQALSETHKQKPSGQMLKLYQNMPRKVTVFPPILKENQKKNIPSA